MKTRFNPKEALAKVSNVAITAYLASKNADPVVAQMLGALGEGVIKGISINKPGATPVEELRVVIRVSAEAVLSSKKAITADCREAIISDLFSERSALEYLQAGDIEGALNGRLRKILNDFAISSADALPVGKMANDIVRGIQDGIQNNETLLALDTNVMVQDIKRNVQPLVNLIDKLATQPEPLPKWLTQPPKAVTPHYITRPEHDSLMVEISQHGLVLLHGMGGLGKTECMRKICTMLSDNFGHIAWVQYSGSLANSLVSQITASRITGLSEGEKYAAITKMLVDLGKGLLLFVDNLPGDISKDPELRVLETLEGTVIISARPPLPLTSFFDHAVGLLSVSDCKRLFYAYSGKLEGEDEKALESIVTLAGWHTLTLEIIAKAVKARKITIPGMLHMLNEKGFDIRIPVAAAHNNDKLEELLVQLQKLYDISAIKDNRQYLHILKNFAVLPYLPLSREDTVRFLALNEEQEKSLYVLSDLGWLEFSEAGFAMHPVIRQVVQLEHIELDDFREMIEDILDASSGYFERIKYRPYIIQIAGLYQGQDPLVASIYSRTALIYQDMGDLPEALAWQMKAKGIREALYPDGRHPDLATSCNNLSMIYRAMGKLPEALEWQMKAKGIREALYPDGRHPDLATSYNNLSTIYQAMGNLTEALEWQMKAIGIMEALYPDGRHPDLATSYNNLSMIFRAMGILPEALEWQMKDKKITEALYPDGRHPALAISYSNLSMIYMDMSNLPKALEWQMKAKRIKETLYPDGRHPTLSTSYNNLSLIYHDMGDLLEAHKWKEKAKSATGKK